MCGVSPKRRWVTTERKVCFRVLVANDPGNLKHRGPVPHSSYGY